MENELNQMQKELNQRMKNQIEESKKSEQEMTFNFTKREASLLSKISETDIEINKLSKLN